MVLLYPTNTCKHVNIGPHSTMLERNLVELSGNKVANTNEGIQLVLE